MATRQIKAGNGKDTAAHRRKIFIDTYLSNGRNATQAAISAGYSEKTAYAQGSRLLKNVEVAQQVAIATAKAEEESGLTAERVLQEIARVAFQDPRKAFRESGGLKDVHELDDDTAAALASFEVTEEFQGKGGDRELVGYTKKIKFWDKNTALVTAARHLGLFEKDNKQRAENLALQVVLVQPGQAVA